MGQIGFSSRIASILSCSFSQIEATLAVLSSIISRFSWLTKMRGGGGQAGAERELFSRLNLKARVFLAALAYELSFALRFTEGDLDLESTGETSRMLSNRLTDRKELFLAKLAEESLK